jgi:transposase-like protein
VNDASHESVAPKLRRQFTASEKLRLVKAADVALASGERGALEALLRKEAIYSSQLATWRQQLGTSGEPGLASRKPGRKPKLGAAGRELLAVTKQNETSSASSASPTRSSTSQKTIGSGDPFFRKAWPVGQKLPL